MNRLRIIGTTFMVALSMGLAARPPWAGDNAGPGQQTGAPIRFAFGGNAAEIPAEFVGNLIFLPARINNSKPSLFLIDSTAAVSSMAPSRLAELGFSTLENPVLTLAGIELSFASLPARAKDNLDAQTGRSYQGTLGNDFLRSVVADIDYGRQTVRLYDPAIYKYAGNGTAFPLTFAGELPLIQAKLTLPGQKAREGRFIVNAALDAAIVISEKFAEGHHLFSAHLKTIRGSDPQFAGGENIVLGRPKEFQIGSYAVEGAIAEFSPRDPYPSAGAEVAGVIGGGILRRFTVIFDYPHQRLIFAPNLRLHELEEEDKSGLTIVARGPGLKQFQVVAVQPGTPGAHAGIQRGDVIAGIDEEPAADLTLVEIRELFREAGRTRKLALDRKGQSLQVSISLRRLLPTSGGS